MNNSSPLAKVNNHLCAHLPQLQRLHVRSTHGLRGTSSFATVALLILTASCGGKPSASGVNTTSTGGGGTTNNGSGGQAASYSTVGTSSTNTGTGGVSSLPPLPAACPGLPVTTNASDAGSQCTPVGLELEPPPLDMYLIIDRSQSMVSPIQGTTFQSWDIVQQGLQLFFNTPSIQTAAPRVGLGFFGDTGNPNDPTECDPGTYAAPKIEIGPIATTGPEILQSLSDERALLGGATPWFPALQGSLIHAQGWQVANPTRMTAVVLVAGGLPTECDQNTRDIEQMLGSFYTGVQGTFNTRGQPGIHTFVVGVGMDRFDAGDGGTRLLDPVAQAGGTRSATVLDGTGAVNDFVTALVNITNSYISCSIALPPLSTTGKVFDPSKAQVIYQPFQGTNQEIPMASSATGCGEANGGWYYDNPINPTMMTLCPCSCANLGAGSVEVIYGCRPIVGILP